MASSVMLRRHIDYITQCPICLEKFHTPTSLPCLHTFCLSCLQRTFSTDHPGDVAACPVCRRDFKLPPGGLAALPKNFTIGGLVELAVSSTPANVTVTQTLDQASNDKRRCGVIVDDDDEVTKCATAKADEDDLRSVDRQSTDEEFFSEQDEQAKSSTSTDDVTHSHHGHTDVDVVEFCFDCHVDVCSTCCADLHRNHRRRRLAAVTAECQRRVVDELARITDALNATHVAVFDVDHRRVDMLRELQQKEEVTREQCDDEVVERLDTLSAEKDDALRQLAVRKEHLEVDQMCLETFLKDGTQRFVTASTTAGLLRAVKETKVEANSLLRAHKERLHETDVDGKQRMSWAELVTTLVDKKPSVIAVTSLLDELYVARSDSHYIEVFDVVSFKTRRRLTVTGTQRSLFNRSHATNITDMTSCPCHQCIYVADLCGRLVRRLDCKNGNQVTEWSVGGKSAVGLSVTSTYNVVIACSDSLSLQIFTALGCPVCEISVPQPGLVGLVHGVQLNCGSFAVIGITDSGQRLACVYRNDSDITEPIDSVSAGCPTYLALVGGRAHAGSYLWLAERANNAGVRLIEIPASQCSAKLRRIELEEPTKMCWDDSSQRLYIVDQGRVKVFCVKMKFDMFS